VEAPRVRQREHLGLDARGRACHDDAVYQYTSVYALLTRGIRASRPCLVPRRCSLSKSVGIIANLQGTIRSGGP